MSKMHGLEDMSKEEQAQTKKMVEATEKRDKFCEEGITAERLYAIEHRLDDVIDTLRKKYGLTWDDELVIEVHDIRLIVEIFGKQIDTSCRQENCYQGKHNMNIIVKSESTEKKAVLGMYGYIKTEKVKEYISPVITKLKKLTKLLTNENERLIVRVMTAAILSNKFETADDFKKFIDLVCSEKLLTLNEIPRPKELKKLIQSILENLFIAGMYAQGCTVDRSDQNNKKPLNPTCWVDNIDMFEGEH